MIILNENASIQNQKVIFGRNMIFGHDSVK